MFSTRNQAKNKPLKPKWQEEVITVFIPKCLSDGKHLQSDGSNDYHVPTVTPQYILQRITTFSSNRDHTALNDRGLSAPAEQKVPLSTEQRCANVSSAKTEITIALQSHLSAEGPVSGNVASAACKYNLKR